MQTRGQYFVNLSKFGIVQSCVLCRKGSATDRQRWRQGHCGGNAKVSFNSLAGRICPLRNPRKLRVAVPGTLT